MNSTMGLLNFMIIKPPKSP